MVLHSQVMKKDAVLRDGSVVGDVANEEIKTLTTVQFSRHVIHLFGSFETKSHIILVMEWAPCDFFQLMTDNFGTYR